MFYLPSEAAPVAPIVGAIRNNERVEPSEILPRALVALLGYVVVIIGWFITARLFAVSLATAGALGLAVAGVSWMIFRSLRRAAQLDDLNQANLAIGGLLGFGAPALYLAFSNGFYDPTFLARMLIAGSQAAGAMLLGFSTRTAVITVPAAIVMTAADLPLGGIVLITLVLAIYLEARPPAWLPG